MNDKLVLYLATPYAHEDPDIMRRRYQLSCLAAAKLMSAGIVVFNPLANTVPAVELGGLDLTHDDFLKIDLEILQRCDELLILGLPEWEKSDGVKTEMFKCLALRKPITLIEEADIENLPAIPVTTKTFLTSYIFHDTSDHLERVDTNGVVTSSAVKRHASKKVSHFEYFP